MKKHLNLDDFIELYYESESDSSRWIRDHLDSCERCKQEFESYTATLDKADSFHVRDLNPNEHVKQFEQIWSQYSKSVHSNHRTWKVFEYFRHPAFMFAFGTFFGILVTILAINGSLDPVREAAAEPNLRWETNGITQTISGKIVDRLYPELENPTITVVETQEKTEKKKKMLHGTMNNGSVQIIWNL